eukprot:6195535-Pleurochrysis_carterae.AAC.5
MVRELNVQSVDVAFRGKVSRPGFARKAADSVIRIVPFAAQARVWARAAARTTRGATTAAATCAD